MGLERLGLHARLYQTLGRYRNIFTRTDLRTSTLAGLMCFGYPGQNYCGSGHTAAKAGHYEAVQLNMMECSAVPNDEIWESTLLLRIPVDLSSGW